MPQVILVERSRLCAMAAAGNVLELADSYHLGATLISLLQLFQLSPAPGIHHGISVALLLSSLKNHTLSKFN